MPAQTDDVTSDTINYETKDVDMVVEILLTMDRGVGFEEYNGIDDCQICLNNMHKEYVLSYGCGNFFHRNCLLQSITHMKYIGCPTCNCAR